MQKRNHLKIRERLIIQLFEHSKNVYRQVFKRNKKAWNTSINELSKFENGTLGKDLANFLNKNNFALEPKLEKHEIYHILTGYPTTVVGEICLSLFNVANGKRSIYTGGVAFLGAFLLLEEYQTFKTAYQKGKKARAYVKWEFEHLLNENTNNLKALLFKQQIENKEIFI